MITKHVRPDEIGKILAFVAAMQNFIPLVSSPIFGIIYRSTVEFFPQTIYLILAGFFLIDLTCMVIVDRGLRKVDKQQKLMKASKVEDAEDPVELQKFSIEDEKQDVKSEESGEKDEIDAGRKISTGVQVDFAKS